MTTKPKILIADDEKDIRELLQDLLQKEYQIVEAKDGEIALQHLQDQSYDLALLDIMMPKVDGYEVVLKMKEQNINAPFIFLTAKGESKDRIKGIELGADDYITKPFTNKELQLRIKRKLFIQRKINLRNKRLQLMNHNIITPTGVIQGSLQILMNLVDQMKKKFLITNISENCFMISKKDVDEMANKFNESIELMNESTEQLINLSRNLSSLFGELNLQTTKLKIPVDQFVFETVSLLKPKKLKCQINQPIQSVQLKIDSEKLRSVFFEILDNVTLHNDQKSPYVVINSKVKDDKIIFSFTDNGRGIDQSDYTNIFEEFWSAYENKNHTRGQGIGLWICQRYITAHKGDIWVDHSKIGEGSTICFSLPIS